MVLVIFRKIFFLRLRLHVFIVIEGKKITKGILWFLYHLKLIILDDNFII